MPFKVFCRCLLLVSIPWSVLCHSAQRLAFVGSLPSVSNARTNFGGSGIRSPLVVQLSLLRFPDEDEIDEFLDTPFFDPEKVLRDEESDDLSKNFAQFVKDDYGSAEALLSGAFIFILVILSQETVRMTIYGNNYVPFHQGGGGFL